MNVPMLAEISDICVFPDMKLRDGLKRLEDTHKRILLVVDNQNKLVGVVTDADFRRAIISETSMDAPVAKMMTCEPITCIEGTQRQTILRMMKEHQLQEIPVIDQNRKIVDLARIEDLLPDSKVTRTAVVMAGGMGSRLRPLTNTTPKPLLEVGGQPILFTVLDQLISIGYNPIYVTLNYMADRMAAVINAVPQYRMFVKLITETTPLGTLGSLSLLPERPAGPFLVTNADLLTTIDYEAMRRHHMEEGSSLTISIRKENYSFNYGVVETDGEIVTSILEKPTKYYYANAGTYYLSPEVLDHVLANEPIDAPAFIELLIKKGYLVKAFPLHEYWIDIGRHKHLEQARSDYTDIFGRNEMNGK